MSKNKIFLHCHSSVKWSDPGDFLKAQFVIFRCQKYVKKRVHGNEKMNLPCVFKKCPESLHFTLLLWVHLWVWHCLILSFYTLKKKWLQNCPSDFKPHYYRWYVDDVRILFISLEHLEAFQNFLNGWHGKISFAIENEK